MTEQITSHDVRESSSDTQATSILVNKIQRMAQATHCEHLPWHGFDLYELTFPWDNPGQRLPLEMILMTTLSGGGREMQAMPWHRLQSQRT